MCAISAALVLLSGTVLVAVAAALAMGAKAGQGEEPIVFVGVTGLAIGLLGLIAWLVAFLVDKEHRA